jgi:hypothetical protein
MKKITIILVLFALALTACSVFNANADPNNAKVEKITPSPDTASMQLAAEPMIVFQRSGGFAGKTEQWSIYASGKISKLNGAEITVDPAQVTALLDAIQASGFYQMKTGPSMGGPSNCKDCFTYQLTVNTGEKPQTIAVQDGAKDVPEAFWSIIQQINILIAGPANQ